MDAMIKAETIHEQSITQIEDKIGRVAASEVEGEEAPTATLVDSWAAGTVGLAALFKHMGVELAQQIEADAPQTTEVSTAAEAETEESAAAEAETEESAAAAAHSTEPSAEAAEEAAEEAEDKQDE